METYEQLNISQLLNPSGFACSCGKVHTAGVDFIKVEHGALVYLPEALRSVHIQKPMVVLGPKVATRYEETIKKILIKNKIDFEIYILQAKAGKKLQPNEEAIQQVIQHYHKACDGILAVGSGSVNDVCKMAATQLQIPQITIGTAPSMDGYVSASSSLEINNTKASIPANAPKAVICDTELMAQAPRALIYAGFGDVLAKVSSLCEWEIVALIQGEYRCAAIDRMVRKTFLQTLYALQQKPLDSEKNIESVIRGLLLSGVCMSFVDSSRPASGLEHYFSHCWEMMKIAKGQEYNLHGIYVGVGTLLTLRVYKKLLDYAPDENRLERAIDRFDSSKWESRLRKAFGTTADEFIKLEKEIQKNNPDTRRERFFSIQNHWEDICEIIRRNLGICDADYLEKIMREAGMPTRPSEIGISQEEVLDAFVCSRDTREKYLLSDLIWDLGLTEEFENFLRDYA